jgi:hypothetical protein
VARYERQGGGGRRPTRRVPTEISARKVLDFVLMPHWAAGAGAAQSTLTDTERAEVFNGVVRNLSADPPPAAMREFTGEEVRRYRRGPWWRCASRASVPWA